MNKKFKKDIHYWENHIARWQKSDLSKREYCRREDISYWTFRDRIKKEDIPSGSKKLIKLPKSIRPYTGDTETGIEIRIRNKISINIKKGFDGELLRTLLKELGAAE